MKHKIVSIPLIDAATLHEVCRGMALFGKAASEAVMSSRRLAATYRLACDCRISRESHNPGSMGNRAAGGPRGRGFPPPDYELL